MITEPRRPLLALKYSAGRAASAPYRLSASNPALTLCITRTVRSPLRNVSSIKTILLERREGREHVLRVLGHLALHVGENLKSAGEAHDRVHIQF